MARGYRDPIITKLIEVLEAEGPKQLKGRYYLGDPLVVPKSVLPAAFITKDTTVIDAETNAEDRSEITYVINVVYDLTRDFGSASKDGGSTNALYEVMEARDEHYNIAPGAICYVLRAHEQLDDQLWFSPGTTVEPSYGVGVEKRGAGLYSVEAVVKVTLRHIQLWPGR